MDDHLTPLDEIFREDHPWEKRGDRFAIWTGASRYIEPLRRLPFTPVLTCEPGASLLMDRFDWHMVPLSAWGAMEVATEKTNVGGEMACGPLDGRPWKNMSGAVRDPSTVWAAPHSLHRLLEHAERDFDPSHSRRAVVFSGSEMPLSRFLGESHAERLNNLRRLRKYFGVINVMTRDIELDGVGIAPMGLGWGYMISMMDYWIRDIRRRKDVADRNRAYEAIISCSLEVKTKNMLATRALWASWLESPVMIRRAKMFEDRGVLFPPSNSSNQIVMLSIQSRLALQGWSQAPEAQSAGVELRSIPLAVWWPELQRYRFLLAPLGSAIQTAKQVEALLVLTIPVIERTPIKAHDALVDLGFPLVLVERWSNITQEKADGWWRELSPRLESFRRNCLTVDGYWGMFIGKTTRCL